MKRCEVVLDWGDKKRPITLCGTEATRRYPTMDGGFMYLCDEHSVKHLNYTEPASSSPLETAEKERIETMRWAINDAFPTTWLDPILSGETAVLGKSPWNCPDIERLLAAVKERLIAAAAMSRPTDGDGR